MIDTTVPVNVRDLFGVRVAKVEVSSSGHRVKAVFELTSIKTSATKSVAIQYDPPTPISKESRESGVQRCAVEAWRKAMNLTSAGGDANNAFTDVTWKQIVYWAMQELSKPSTYHTIDV
jgi:hypothetical protein